MTTTLIDCCKTSLTVGEAIALVKRYVRLHPLQDVHLDGTRMAIVADEVIA